METIWQDIRYGVRMLVRSPGFSVVALLTLALGVGANTAIFTVINAVFLSPLQVEEPARLVDLFTTDEKQSVAGASLFLMSRLNYEDFRDQNEVFSGLVLFANAGLTLGGRDEPKQIGAQMVTGNYFDVLGVRPAHGRTFLPDEDTTPGTHPVVVVSHGLWQREFGGDPNLVGSTLLLNNQPFTVIGIAPEGFKGTASLANPDLVWVPMSMHDVVLTNPTIRQWFDMRRALMFNVFGRLKPDVPVEQAEVAMKTIAKRLEEAYPNDNESRSVALRPLTGINPNQRGQFTKAGALLAIVVGFVLLIACVNVANLQLARATVREREVAVRASIGASPSRLFRQLLTESLLLAFLGGLLGLAVAYWGRELLWAFRPPFLNQNAVNLELDLRVLGFTFGVSLLTGILFGLVPAWQSSRTELFESLKEGRRSSGGGSRRLRSALVVGEVALALVALVGAGLFLRSLRHAQSIDPGFETRKLLFLFINLGGQRYEQPRAEQFYDDGLARMAATPGVESAAFSTNPILGGGLLRSITPEGQEPPPGTRGTLTLTNSVTPDYFRTVGLTLLRGRVFSNDDREKTPRVAVINEAMAKRHWPGEEAVGKRFRYFGDDRLIEIVGVVVDSNYFNIGEDPQPIFFLPMRQNYSSLAVLNVRSIGAPESVLGTVRSEVQALDRNLPIGNINTVDAILSQALWAPRMGAALLGIFGGLALVLAAVGLYGVMAYTVSQRTHEIGIRMAMGAQKGDILRLVIRHGMILTLIGVAVGLLGSLAAARGVGTLLFGVSARDPLTLAVVSLLLAAVALVACYVPARRAVRVDPLVALRYE